MSKPSPFVGGDMNERLSVMISSAFLPKRNARWMRSEWMAARLLGSWPTPRSSNVRERRVVDVGRVEAIEPCVARLHDARRLVFVPRLVGRDLQRLRRPRLAVEHLLALVALPREFVIVPHGHERPARARVLQIGVGEIAAVGRAIVVERRRQVEVAASSRRSDSARCRAGAGRDPRRRGCLPDTRRPRR